MEDELRASTPSLSPRARAVSSTGWTLPTSLRVKESALEEHRVHRPGVTGAGREPERHSSASAGRAASVRPPVDTCPRARRARRALSGWRSMVDRTCHRPGHPGRRPVRSGPHDAPTAGGLCDRNSRLARPDPASRLDWAMRPRLAAGANLRAASASTARLLRQASGGRPDESGDQRRGYLEPVALPGPHTAPRLVLQPDRDSCRHADTGLAVWAGVVYHHPRRAPPQHLLFPPP